MMFQHTAVTDRDMITGTDKGKMLLDGVVLPNNKTLLQGSRRSIIIRQLKIMEISSNGNDHA